MSLRASRARLARASVVRHEVARLDVQVFEIQRVRAGDRDSWRRDAQRYHSFSAAAHGINKLKAVDAEVVFGLGLDVHLFERRYFTVTRRFEHADFRKPILERADEVLGVAWIGEALTVCQRHAIRAIFDNRERPRQHIAGLRCQRDRLAIGERHAAGGSRTHGVDSKANVSTHRRVDVAAIFFGSPRQAQGRRVGVLEIDARDARRLHNADLVGRRRHGADDNTIFERHADGLDRERESARPIGRHFRDTPRLVLRRTTCSRHRLGAQYLCHDRSTIADEPRFDAERRSRP